MVFLIWKIPVSLSDNNMIAMIIMAYCFDCFGYFGFFFFFLSSNLVGTKKTKKIIRANH